MTEKKQIEKKIAKTRALITDLGETRESADKLKNYEFLQDELSALVKKRMELESEEKSRQD